jgi:hypothetical protein
MNEVGKPDGEPAAPGSALSPLSYNLSTHRLSDVQTSLPNVDGHEQASSEQRNNQARRPAPLDLTNMNVCPPGAPKLNDVSTPLPWGEALPTPRIVGAHPLSPLRPGLMQPRPSAISRPSFASSIGGHTIIPPEPFDTEMPERPHQIDSIKSPPRSN